MGKNLELTTVEKKVLAAYHKFTERQGAPPSVRMLAHKTGVARSSVQYVLGRLREKGFLSPRPITLVRPRLSAKGRDAL